MPISNAWRRNVAENAIYEKLVSQQCEELDYFMKYILPSFDMNLDEIK